MPKEARIALDLYARAKNLFQKVIGRYKDAEVAHSKVVTHSKTLMKIVENVFNERSSNITLPQGTNYTTDQNRVRSQNSNPLSNPASELIASLGRTIEQLDSLKPPKFPTAVYNNNRKIRP